MSAHSLGLATTLPLFHQIMVTPDIWTETPHGREIALRDALEPLPAWAKLPAVRGILFPMVANLQIVRVGSVFVIEVDPGKEMALDGEGDWWYEAVLASTPDVTSVFGEERMFLPPGSLWMWQTPMVRQNLSAFKSMSLIMQLEAA